MRRIEWAGAWAFCAALAGSPAFLHAQAELDTVRAMLKLDADEALARERALSPKASAPSGPVVRRDRVAVSAIYGIAGGRTAVLDVNGERREYREGSEWPRGHLASPREYRLVRIEHGCVHLTMAAGKAARVACFFPVPDDEPGRPQRVAGTTPPSMVPGSALGMPVLSRGVPR